MKLAVDSVPMCAIAVDERSTVQSPRNWMKSHTLLTYMILTLAFTWACWIPRVLHGAVVRPGEGAAPTYMLGLLGPMAAAFVVTALEGGRKAVMDLLSRIFRWRIGVKWLAISMASPIVFYFAGVLVLRLIRGIWPRWSDLGYYGGLPELGIGGVWILATLINGFGEETGWRGFALPRLRKRYSFLRSSVLLAIPWAIWHIPAFFFIESYMQMDLAVLPGFLLGLTCGSVVLAWLYEKTSGSILAVALWHGSFNLVSATLGARGFPAAFVSTSVMIWAVWIATRELRRPLE